MPADPLVSVVLSVNRDRGRLDATMRSVLEQYCTDFELIVVNDAAPPDVRTRLDHWCREDRRVRVVENAANLGLTRSLNRGLDRARGRYIARIDEGDLWLPEKLAAQIRRLEAAPDVAIIGTRYRNYQDGDPRGTSGTCLPLEDHEIRRWLFVGRTPLIHPSIVFRRGLARYNDGARTSQDFELYLRLSLIGRLNNLPDELLLSYTPADAVSVRNEHVQFFNHVQMHRAFMQALTGRSSRETFIAAGTDFDRIRKRSRLHASYVEVALRTLRALPKRSMTRRVLRNLLVPEFFIYYVQTRSAPYRLRRTFESYLDGASPLRP